MFHAAPVRVIQAVVQPLKTKQEISLRTQSPGMATKQGNMIDEGLIIRFALNDQNLNGFSRQRQQLSLKHSSKVSHS